MTQMHQPDRPIDHLRGRPAQACFRWDEFVGPTIGRLLASVSVSVSALCLSLPVYDVDTLVYPSHLPFIMDPLSRPALHSMDQNDRNFHSFIKTQVFMGCVQEEERGDDDDDNDEVYSAYPLHPAYPRRPVVHYHHRITMGHLIESSSKHK